MKGVSQRRRISKVLRHMRGRRVMILTIICEKFSCAWFKKFHSVFLLMKLIEHFWCKKAWSIRYRSNLSFDHAAPSISLRPSAKFLNRLRSAFSLIIYPLPPGANGRYRLELLFTSLRSDDRRILSSPLSFPWAKAAFSSVFSLRHFADYPSFCSSFKSIFPSFFSVA